MSEKQCLEYIDNVIHTTSSLVLFIDCPADNLLSTLRQRKYPPTLLAVPLVEDEDSEMLNLINLGAADVVAKSLFESTRLRGLIAQARRSAATFNNPTTKWIGAHTTRKEGVTQEEMFIEAFFKDMFLNYSISDFSSLSSSSPESVFDDIDSDKKEYFRRIIGDWDFPAHQLSDDDLANCAYYIFEHAFTMPEVKSFILPLDQLKKLICVLRKSYQPVNPYHNFRHVVDVLQATFCFLLFMDVIPPTPSLTTTTSATATTTSTTASAHHQHSFSHLLGPVDALALLVTAIGHDVGHPGVTNSFLISARSPLARIYSDRSVLESFHCAAFSQILSKYWPSVRRERAINDIIVESILATDMAVHGEYMHKISVTMKDIAQNGGKILESDCGTNKRLLCACLIKCADISNVVRA